MRIDRLLEDAVRPTYDGLERVRKSPGRLSRRSSDRNRARDDVEMLRPGIRAHHDVEDAPGAAPDTVEQDASRGHRRQTPQDRSNAFGIDERQVRKIKVTGPACAIAGTRAVSTRGADDMSISPLRKNVLVPSPLIAKSLIVAPFSRVGGRQSMRADGRATGIGSR